MAVKSIIEVDVESAEFERFNELFGKYSKMLDNMPGQWAAGAKAMTAAIMAQTSAQKQSAAMAQDAQKKAADEARSFVRESSTATRVWTELGTAAGVVAARVSSITGNLLRWGTLTGFATGLLGAGGSLFGMEALARSISGTVRTSQGFGVTPGQRAALGVNFGRFFDTDAVLSNIAEARSDYSRRWAFSAMGVSHPEGKDPATLALEMTDRARALYGQNQSQQWAAAHGLLQFFTMEDLRRISAGDVASAARGYGVDVQGLDYKRGQQKAWQDFQVQLNRAGEKIENAFGRNLDKIAPLLEKMSDGLVMIVQALANSQRVKAWIDELANALQGLATWLTGTGGTDASGGFSMSPQGANDNRPPWARWEFRNFYPRYENLTGSVPKDLLSAIALQESGGNPNALSSKGAAGLFQFMPETWKQYGEGSPYDPQQSVKAATRYIYHLEKVFGNDLEKVLAAYNWGEGNLLADIHKWGDRWREHLPEETKKYVNSVVAATTSKATSSDWTGGTRIVIVNATGGNAVVTSNQGSQ